MIENYLFNYLHFSTGIFLEKYTGHNDMTADNRSLLWGINSSANFLTGGSKSVIIIPSRGKLASLEKQKHQ